MREKEKPTIAELENMLKENPKSIEILPNGDVVKTQSLEEPTEQEIEKMAERVHHVYCDYHLAVRGVPYWTNGDYSKLEENIKEANRYMARFFLNVLKRYMPMAEHNNREQELLTVIRQLEDKLKVL